MTETNLEKAMTEFKKIMRLWAGEGYSWRMDFGSEPFSKLVAAREILYLEFLIPGGIPGSEEYDCCIAIDTLSYSCACYNPHTYKFMVISEKEHKLITKTINNLKKINQLKEVENDN